MEKIKDVKKLSKGVSKIHIEGTVVYNKYPVEINGRNGTFWSQYIVVEDDTGTIGVNLGLKKEAEGVENGDKVRVRGTTDEYTDKEGELQKKLKNGYLVMVIQDKPDIPDEEEDDEEEDRDLKTLEKNRKEEEVKVIEKTKFKNEFVINGKDDYWKAKLQLDIMRLEMDKERIKASNRLIARECAGKVTAELINGGKLKLEKFKEFAEGLVDFYYNGHKKEEETPLKKHTSEKRGLEKRKGTYKNPYKNTDEVDEEMMIDDEDIPF